MDRTWIVDVRRELGLTAFVCHCGCCDWHLLRRARCDCSVEQIPAPRYGLDQAVIVVRKFAAQLADALSNGIVRNGDIRPDRIIELLLGDQTAGMVSEVFEDLKGLRP